MTLMTTPPTTVAPWRLFRTVVGAVDDLSPSLRRIRFVGQELEHFADPGLDQRIKILLGAWPATFAICHANGSAVATTPALT